MTRRERVVRRVSAGLAPAAAVWTKMALMSALEGEMVRLRPAGPADIPALAAIRATPEVHEHWRGGTDMEKAVQEDLDEPDSHPYVIELEGRVVGYIQWEEEEEPDYRHAAMDIYVDPAVHGRGVGTDAVRTVARHLFVDRGHHRLVIDPAAGNAAAIRCYTKVGFRPVGVARRSERGNDGTWHDSLMMDLLVEEFSWDRAPVAPPSPSVAQSPQPGPPSPPAGRD